MRGCVIDLRTLGRGNNEINDRWRKTHMATRSPSWVSEILESRDDVVYLLDRKLHIEACNPGWDVFAGANDAVGISRAEVRERYIFDFIPDVLVSFYERKYNETLHSEHWIGFDYECSSPEVFRVFHMAMYPVENSGLLVVSSPLAKYRYRMLMHQSDLPDPVYLSPNGVVTMCAHCRKTRREKQAHVWDWVPRFLRKTERTISHGLCPTCVTYFYPEFAALHHYRDQEDAQSP